MKKHYILPVTDAAMMALEDFMASSGVEGIDMDNSSDDIIEYGGIDESGDKDPASHKENSVWDEDE